jgi:hypothetical protein
MKELRDSAGNVLYERGVHTSNSHEHLHVCFDQHFSLGRRVWLYSTKSAREFVLQQEAAGVMPVYGSKAWGVQDTGAGYLAEPKDIFAMSFDLLESDTDEHEVAQRMFYRWGYRYRRATHDEDVGGTDWVTIDRWKVVTRFQIKRREPNKLFDYLFLQTHETNPDKVYR